MIRKSKIGDLDLKLRDLKRKYGDDIYDFTISANKINGIPLIILKDGVDVIECICLHERRKKI